MTTRGFRKVLMILTLGSSHAASIQAQYPSAKLAAGSRLRIWDHHGLGGAPVTLLRQSHDSLYVSISVWRRGERALAFADLDSLEVETGHMRVGGAVGGILGTLAGAAAGITVPWSTVNCANRDRDACDSAKGDAALPWFFVGALGGGILGRTFGRHLVRRWVAVQLPSR
jgi:hypothetical protein